MFIFRWIKKLILFIFFMSILALLLMSRCSLPDGLGDLFDFSQEPSLSVELPEAAMGIIDQVKVKVARERGIDPDLVKLKSAEFIIWPNTCLGIRESTRNCQNRITPGYKIVFEINGQSLTYHSDEKGNYLAY